MFTWFVILDEQFTNFEQIEFNFCSILLMWCTWIDSQKILHLHLLSWIIIFAVVVQKTRQFYSNYSSPQKTPHLVLSKITGNLTRNICISSIQSLTIALLANIIIIMLLQLIKKLFGNCQIRIFTLSKVLTLVELVLSILAAVFMIGIKVGHYHLGVPIGTWYEWLIDIIAIVCLGLEFLGLQKKIFGLIVFSCVFRCIGVLGLFLNVIALFVINYFLKPRLIVESKSLESEDIEPKTSLLELLESPAW